MSVPIDVIRIGSPGQAGRWSTSVPPASSPPPAPAVVAVVLVYVALTACREERRRRRARRRSCGTECVIRHQAPLVTRRIAIVNPSGRNFIQNLSRGADPAVIQGAAQLRSRSSSRPCRSTGATRPRTARALGRSRRCRPALLVRRPIGPQERLGRAGDARRGVRGVESAWPGWYASAGSDGSPLSEWLAPL